MNNSVDLVFMKKALQLAEEAKKQGEVPVGAVLVQKNQVIATGYNQSRATAHAEMEVIEKACQNLKTRHLLNCTLYVTLEPCPMCAGAIVLSRIKRLVYASKDPKSGAVHSLYQIPQDPRLNHRVEVQSGILQEPCSAILKKFFQEKRKS